jgi:5-formyltetrahydrofolate cyclo-ligase
LTAAINFNKKIVVPFCTVDGNGQNTLGLWHLKKLSELQIGSWNILEPPESIRQNHPEQIVDPSELDIVLVPGVAFDKNGGRLGNGQGYYDRLLADVRPDCLLVGVCFECQIFNDVCLESHDIEMNCVITEIEKHKPD